MKWIGYSCDSVGCISEESVPPKEHPEGWAEMTVTVGAGRSIRSVVLCSSCLRAFLAGLDTDHLAQLGGKKKEGE